MLRMIAHCPAGQTLRASQPDRQDNLQHLRWFRSLIANAGQAIPEKILGPACLANSRKFSPLTPNLTSQPEEECAVTVSSSYHPLSSRMGRLSNIGQSNHGTKLPPCCHSFELYSTTSVVYEYVYGPSTDVLSTPRERRHFLRSVCQQSVAVPSPTPSLTPRLEFATRRHHLLVH
ncbi:hypothetical protein IW261DRAFT_505863 [Armillaria novae-zelandiae]|uniref:Uncharacterized protein n=1 Tax=Armillaria novae-zelandiae TaxID=153914 RepID=A0AA39UAE0_9AGAR|nr:hypothetical protein IW261DRAFT_505863 [Armillaria novae-zelandiae]